MNSRNGIHVTYYVPGTFSKHRANVVVEKEKVLKKVVYVLETEGK